MKTGIKQYEHKKRNAKCEHKIISSIMNTSLMMMFKPMIILNITNSMIKTKLTS